MSIRTKARTALIRHQRGALIAGTITVGMLAVGTAAYAYWTSTGTGTASASTGTSDAFVVTADAAVGSGLTPGGGSQTIDFTVENPSTGSQNLSNVTVTVATSIGGVWTSGTCDAADFSVGTPTISYGEIAGGATVSGSVTISMLNLPSNQDDCKSVSVPLYFSAS